MWTPQTEFPQIPFFSVLTEVPGWADWLLLAGTAIGLAVMIGYRRDQVLTWGVPLFLVAAIGLVLLNQHRLQAWTYLLVVATTIAFTLPSRLSLNFLRALLISVYVFSAISKLDYQFTHTVGQQMWSSVWPDFTSLSESIRIRLAVALPIGELLVALLLCIPGKIVRGVGLWAAVTMHCGLILLFSPLGLDQLPGVIIWNAQFIVMLLILFSPDYWWDADEPNQQPRHDPGRSLSTVGVVFACFVILFPLTQFWGICDHWPAWELYAPRTSRTRLILEPGQPRMPGLPVRTTRLLGLNTDEVDWAEWSQSALGVPIYPQARFQLGCCRALLTLEDAKRPAVAACVLESAADHRTGSRNDTRIRVIDIPRFGDQQYWLNTQPRPIFKGPEWSF